MAPYELTLAEAGAQIAAGQLSPVELVDSVLARIEAVEPRLGAFATVTAEQAREQAAQAAQEIADGHYRGPLHGLPVGLKDLFDTAGVTTTCSSRVRADHVPTTDAAVVSRLAAAGAVMVGKTHTHEFAFGTITPTTRNPWDTDRIPGGSSGGTAAAVAAGECLAGMGSDTGGSIRIPAALCGVVGLKPTYGRVSRRGVASLSWSLDHVGPLARTVGDAALVLGAIAGYDRADPATVDVAVPDASAALEDGVAGLTLGVPTNYFFDDVQPAVAEHVRAAITVLERLGAGLREVRVPLAGTYMAAEFGMVLPEASAYHQRMLRAKGDQYEPDVRAFLEAGELILATDYLKALRVRTLIQQGWRDLFEEHGLDAIVVPTVAATAAAVGQAEFTWPDDRLENVTVTYVRLSAPGNLTGLPALSVPCGLDGDGLPVGLQVIGRPFAEPTVLRIGHAYEQAGGWGGRRPPL